MSGFGATAVRGMVFIRIESTPVIRLWCGFGDINVPANALDVGAETYIGLGAVTGLPELQQLLNGVAGRAQFGISGVSQAVVELAAGDFASVDGAAINVGLASADADWQIDGTLLWLYDATVDTLDIDIQATEDGGQAYSLSLGVGTANTGRARPDFTNWTNAQHQKLHPTDDFLNRLPTADKTKPWPGG